MRVFTQGKADMGASDFFWNDVIYTVNGALDLGSKPINDNAAMNDDDAINDITSVPASGYKEDSFQPEVGHVYAIKTRDGKYGIIHIKFIKAPYRDATSPYLYFLWRYQPNGSTSFK